MITVLIDRIIMREFIDEIKSYACIRMKLLSFTIYQIDFLKQGIGRLHDVGIDIQIGDLFHNDCRLRITRRPRIISPVKEKAGQTRSSECVPFSFQTHCFYCATLLSNHPREQNDIHSVETLECRRRIDEAIANRPPNDPWTLEVKPSVNYKTYCRHRIISVFHNWHKLDFKTLKVKQV